MHSILMSGMFATIATGTVFWLIIDTFNVNMLSDLKIFGEIIPSEKYQNKYPQLFGNYLKIADLKLPEKAFNYPIFLWSSNEELYFEKILEDARKKNISTLIFEDKDDLYKKFAKPADDLSTYTGFPAFPKSVPADLSKSCDSRNLAQFPFRVQFVFR